MIPTVLGLLYDFLSYLKVKDENSRARNRIHWSEARIRGSGSKKCHGSTTMLKGKSFLFLLGQSSFQLWCDCPRKWGTRQSEERNDPNRRKSLKHINIKNTLSIICLASMTIAWNENINFEDFVSNCFYVLPLPTQVLGYLPFPCPVLNGYRSYLRFVTVLKKGSEYGWVCHLAVLDNDPRQVPYLWDEFP